MNRKKSAKSRRKPRGCVGIWIAAVKKKFGKSEWKYNALGLLADKSAFMRARYDGFIVSTGMDANNVQTWKLV